MPWLTEVSQSFRPNVNVIECTYSYLILFASRAPFNQGCLPTLEGATEKVATFREVRMIIQLHLRIHYNYTNKNVIMNKIFTKNKI